MKVFNRTVYLMNILLSFWVATDAIAAQIKTGVYEVLPGKIGEEILVFSTVDGVAYRLPESATTELPLLEQAKIQKVKVILEVGEPESKEELLIKKVELLSELDEENGNIVNPDSGREMYFSPTVVSESQANSLFNELSPKFKSSSQCFHRAHIWSFRMWKDYRINSMKIFLFFTQRYIREFKYKWWFHVSPMVESYVGELVLDRSYTNGPMRQQPWTNIFIKNHAVCPTISDYNQYAGNQDAAYCYVRKVSMYYFQPVDVQAYDARNADKFGWVKWELETAKKGFGGRLFNNIDIEF